MGLQQHALRGRTNLLLRALHRGETSHSEYDAGWLGRLPSLDDPRVPCFPEVLDVIRRTQRADGSWGPALQCISARLLATLSSVLALHEFAAGGDRERIRRGVEYVRETWGALSSDPEFTIGFELLAPTLLRQVARIGFSLDEPLRQAIALHEGKLERIPEAMIYSPELSVGYSLEFLGDALDLERARELRTLDGSIAGNIAATAYYARASRDPLAYEFLRRCVQRWGADRIPYGSPADLFPRIWSMHNLRMGGLVTAREPRVASHLDVLEANLGPWGMSWSTQLRYGDVDDTNIALALLEWGQRSPDWSVLDAYEGPRHFRTYAGENSPSPSANAHVLSALVEFRPYERESIEKIARYLTQARAEGGYWHDKWHLSPYYATSRVVAAMGARGDTEMLRPTRRWFLETQREDGGWGFFGESTAEETAYGLHALSTLQSVGLEVPGHALLRGERFLLPYIDEHWDAEHVPMWINKVLYAPREVVQSAIVAALALSHRVRGSRPAILP